MDKRLILNTKLHMPSVRHNHIPREALNRKLDEGLQKGHNVILVSAPAGYGKTTLMSGWLSRTGYSCTWLSLDEYDSEPVRFVSYLLAAVREIHPDFGAAIEDILFAPKLSGVETVSSYLIRELEQIQEPFVLVLDDYHAIDSWYINALMGKLLDSAALKIIMVLITRREPLLAFSDLRAAGRITELDTSDLRFNEAEIREFFGRYFNISFDDDMLNMVEEQTEGWAAGMQLTGLSIKNKKKALARNFVEEFRGSNRFITDYLMDEVLLNQEEHIRNFLTATCILKKFSGELCDAVTGLEGSSKIIEQLERENLFIVALDDSHTWYRYHHLFSEFLRAGLNESRKNGMYRKASLWYIEKGFMEEALEYALEAKDGELAESLLKQEAVRLFQNGELKTLLFWLDSLAAIKKERAALLDAYRIICLLLTEEIHLACGVVGSLESMKMDKDDLVAQTLLQAVVSVFCNIDDREAAPGLTEEAVMKLKDTHEFFYYFAKTSIGVVKSLDGRIAEAIDILRRVYEEIRGKGYKFLELIAVANLAVCINFTGKRKEALALCEEVLAGYTDKGGNILPMARILYQPMGILLYYNNRLEEARKYLECYLTYYREMELTYTIEFGEWFYTLLLYSKGEKELAAEILGGFITKDEELKLKQKRELFQGMGIELHTRGKNHRLILAEALDTELNIREKEHEKVAAWLESLEKDSISVLPTAHIHFAYIRALIFQGNLQEARDILREQEKQARNYGRYLELITVLLLEALIQKRMGMETRALELVREALVLAAPEGYVRSFLDEDKEILGLAYKVREAAPEFVDRLLRKEDMPTAKLAELLSNREVEILGLIAAGLSNGEIAAKLYITEGTAKWYIRNIYGKLGVNKRIKAVEKARQLKIIT